MEGNIYQAISDVMADVGVIGKESKSTQGFKYRGIDAVMNALNPALIKHKVFVTPEVLEFKREDRVTNKGNNIIYSVCKVKYKFYTTDGSYIESTVVGEGMDSGDKSINKAMSIAFKYACFQVFCIPTEEMIDPDAEGYEVAPKKDRAVEEAELKTKVIAYVNRHEFDAEKINKICARYKVNSLTEMNYDACKHYIKLVTENGGNIDE